MLRAAPPAWPRLLALLILPLLAHAAGNNGFDHRAHAVPGGPYRVPDLSAVGSTPATVDGSLSHTHYFDPATGATARIVSFRWTLLSSKKVVCSRAVCRIRFPLGKTQLQLTVRDSTGDRSTATTSVFVFKALRPRLRVTYKRNGSGHQAYSHLVAPINFRNPLAFPKFLRKAGFTQEIHGQLSVPRGGSYILRVRCMGGSCTLRLNNRWVLSGSNRVITSKSQRLPKGMVSVQLTYRRRSGSAAALDLRWSSPTYRPFSLVPERRLFHIPNAHAPVVNFVSPQSAPVGESIKLTGTGFVDIKAVYVGSARCHAPSVTSQFILTCTVPAGAGKKIVRVVTAAGESNPVNFVIKAGGGSGNGGGGGGDGGQGGDPKGVGPIGYYQPVAFKQSLLKKSNGATWQAQQITAIVHGPDDRFYIGSMNGFVYALSVDMDNIVRSECRSAKIGDRRSILGVAFNPANTSPAVKLYASVSTLFWKRKNILSYQKGWHNGEVIEMRKTSRHCLEKTATIVSGLPVSNYDHSVNGITFDQYGSLLINVGGTSNAGVSVPNGPLGGIPDSPLSGALLIAPIMKKNFNGRIRYSQYSNTATTTKTSGDVQVFATGLRNSFCSYVHSNGRIYSTDNGANTRFGARSTSCTTQKTPSKEKDSLFLVRKGGFYGYANRNRGRFDKKQCVYRSGKYEGAIAQFEASTNGIIEYTANTFGAQMRGDLLLTKYAVRGEGKTFRVRLNDNGRVASKYQMTGFSGLTAAMSSSGAVLMPRVNQGRVAVLSPIESNPGRLVVTSVHPFMGPRRGGNRVKITGWNLKAPLSATVGGKSCTNIRDYKNGRSFTCVVPAGSGKAPVVVKRLGSSSKSYGYEYWYMGI